MLPLFEEPPPNSIPQSWLILMGFPAEVSTVPTKAPVVGLKPLMVPVLVLLLINSVLLSVPKFEGASVFPGLVERFSADQGLHERPILGKDVDISTLDLFILVGIGDIDLAVDVLNTKGNKAGGKFGVGERVDQLEGAVVNVDFVIPPIGGIEKVAGRVTGNRQAGVDSSGTGVIHRDQRGIGIEMGPAADGAVEGSEEER